MIHTIQLKLSKYIVVFIIFLIMLSSLIGQAPEKINKCGIFFASLGADLNPRISNKDSKIVDLRKKEDQEAFQIFSQLESDKIAIIKKSWLEDTATYKNLKNSNVSFCLLSSQQSIKKLHSPVNGLNVFVALPIDAKGIENVFGRKFDDLPAKIKQMRNVYSTCINEKGICLIYQNTHNGGQTQAQSVLDQISDSNKKSLIVIIAHNSQGNLKFPDGSQLSIKEFDNTLNRTGNVGIVISCETANSLLNSDFSIATLKKLRFEESLAALKEINNEQNMNVADFITQFSNFYSNASKQREDLLGKRLLWKALVIVSSGVAALIVIGGLLDDDD